MQFVKVLVYDLIMSAGAQDLIDRLGGISGNILRNRTWTGGMYIHTLRWKNRGFSVANSQLSLVLTSAPEHMNRSLYSRM